MTALTPEQEGEFLERLEAMFRAHPEARDTFSAHPGLLIEARAFFLRRQEELRDNAARSPYHAAADLERLARYSRRRPRAGLAAKRCLASFAVFAFAFTIMLLYALPLGTSDARAPVVIAGGAAIVAALFGLWNGVRWAQFTAAP